MVTSPAFRAGEHPGASRGLSRAAGLVAGLLLGQIVLGALTTHRGWAALHIGGAVVVTLALGALAAGLGRHEGSPGAGRLHALLGLQLVAGLLAYLVRFTGTAVPGGEVAVLGLPVLHRALAALLLGETLRLALLTWPRAARGASASRTVARPAAPREVTA